MKFAWDENKNRINMETHGISFYDAQYAFADPKRLILEDVKHSDDEKRYFCIGFVNGGVATACDLPSEATAPHFRCWLLAEREKAL